MPTACILDGSPLTPHLVELVARSGARMRVAPSAVKAMAKSRAVVERSLSDGMPHYGINTGFGSLAKQRISTEDLRTLQRNLVRSHAAGALEPLPRDVVRAMMVVLAASLARGFSGVRPIVVRTLADMLNAGVTPVVPSVGSVGASGDLAPLAHVALAMIGEGRCTVGNRETATDKAFAAAGIKPITLDAKEGLALINGTHLMAGWGSLLVQDSLRLHDAARVALAMSIDACRASHSFLDIRLYLARNNPRLAAEADAIAALLDRSAIRESHLEDDPRVQDPYSLRAGPTILGSAAGAITNLEQALALELGGVTDNPLVIPRGSRRVSEAVSLRSADNAILSGANFHGMPLAMPLDYLAVGLSHIAGVSERRSYLITGAFEPESQLKPFLAPKPGLQSGYMIAQYTAAACVNELVGLAMPASVANVSTCAGMEDYNSFGPRAAAKAARGIELARTVVAVELLCAAEGVECHRPLKSGRGVERAIKAIRGVVPRLVEDRSPSPSIAAIAGLIADGELA